MSPDIISSIYSYGVAPAAALVCTSLYIQQMVREKTGDKEKELKVKSDEEKYAKLTELLNKLIDGQQLVLDGIKGLTVNSITLAELSKDLSDDNHDIMNLTNILVQDLKVLAVNQLNLMNGFQKVIEQLIVALKGN